MIEPFNKNAASYDQPPPGYTAGFPPAQPAVYATPQPTGYGHQTIVMQQPAAANQTVIVQQGPMRPQNYMWLSCLVYWCCNCVVGGIAFALSMASSSSADENRMEEARQYGRASLYVSIFGTVLGVISIIVIIVLYVTAWKTVSDNLAENPYYSG